MVASATRKVTVIFTPGEEPDSKTKTIFLGGSAIGDELVAEIVQLKLPVIIVYGSTETASMVTASTFDDYKRFPRAAGKPIGENKILILGKRGNALSVGKIGDVVVSSQAVAKGYFNNPELTKAFFTNASYVTNDVGYVNKEGLLFIKRRKDNVIISGGENIYTKEVEDALQTHPAVLECAVIGIPDERWGEAVHAIVVLKKGYKKGVNVTAEELIDHVKDQIARYKAPKSITFKRTLPKSAQGKILKRELRKKYWEGKERQVA